MEVLQGWQPAEAERLWLERLVRQLPFVSEVLSADCWLAVPLHDGSWGVLAEARPSRAPSFRPTPRVGERLDDAERGVWQAIRGGSIAEGDAGRVIGGRPRHQSAYPIRSGPRTAGVWVVERSLLDEVGHEADRIERFRLAIRRLVSTLMARARLLDEVLLPPVPGDAVLMVAQNGVIRHAGPEVAPLSRRFGFTALVDGAPWQESLPGRGEMRTLAANGLWEEVEISARKGVLSVRIVPLEPADAEVGALLLLRDVTEAREREREMMVKDTIIKEVHHRVKNNLQTIAALLRMQARRTTSGEARLVITDCIDRINSIALVHEYLSHEEVEAVDMKDLAYNLLSALVQGVSSPLTAVAARVIVPKGRLTLASAPATSAALVMNELVQNALKHAFTGRRRGKLDLVLAVEDGDLLVTVEDDGIGLPKGFEPERSPRLGWQIIRTLVTQDLRGSLSISSGSSGTRVLVRWPMGDRPGEGERDA
ncbi:MAG: histidine kinase N-terminal domain-containing protein [Candidatus Sericytochromatia bacterium]|nr:histidine kinase N-terminal domain-containing protein [Candidatus Sericytochromatia bacterium]